MKAGWITSTLGEVCSFENGDRGTNYPSKSDRTSEGVPFINAGHLMDDGLDLENMDYIPRDRFDLLSNGKIRSGDILFCLRGSLGKFASVGALSEGAIASSLVIVRPSERSSVTNGFLLAYFQSDLCAEMIDRFRNGAAQPNLSAKNLREFTLPLPPLPEQRRIVRILDEAFEGVAAAKANAEKNLQNAGALFESHLQSVFAQRGEGWVDEPFGEIVESNVIGLIRNSREQGDEYSYPYVKMNNITRDNRFDFSSFVRVDATQDEVERFSLSDGDFLFNTRNSHELVGKVCVYTAGPDEAVVFNNNIMRVRFRHGIDPRFVLHAFSSKVVAEGLNSLKSGTTNVAAIYYKDLRLLRIPIPPHGVQKDLAGQLDRLNAESTRLASIYQQKLAALDELKKSLLHQAFSGRL